MKSIRILLALSAGALAAIACSSADDEPAASISPDAGPGPSLPPASTSPAASEPPPADAAPPVDAGPPQRLEVVCAPDAGGPCYRSVSGNGGRHYCGLVDDGTVRCWGRDSVSPLTSSVDGGVVAPNDGALGRGDLASALEGATPAPVVGLTNVTQISVGPNLGTCARTSDGAVYCWGRNEFGQLGRPRTEARLPLPTRVEQLPPVDEVALGYRTACAITTGERSLYCWGDTAINIGADAGGTTTFAPQLIGSFRAPLKALAIGTWTTNLDTIIALVDGNVLQSIGAFPAGENIVLTPTTRPRELPNVTAIGAFAYVSDGLLERWRPEPGTLYIPSSAEVVQVAIAGANEQGGALLAGGRLFRWGINEGGALGMAPDFVAASKHPLEMPVSKVVSFATTDRSTCASLVDGKIVCWGGNVNGELGRGTMDSNAHPSAEEIR